MGITSLIKLLQQFNEAHNNLPKKYSEISSETYSLKYLKIRYNYKEIMVLTCEEAVHKDFHPGISR